MKKMIVIHCTGTTEDEMLSMEDIAEISDDKIITWHNYEFLGVPLLLILLSILDKLRCASANEQALCFRFCNDFEIIEIASKPL